MCFSNEQFELGKMGKDQHQSATMLHQIPKNQSWNWRIGKTTDRNGLGQFIWDCCTFFFIGFLHFVIEWTSHWHLCLLQTRLIFGTKIGITASIFSIFECFHLSLCHVFQLSTFLTWHHQSQLLLFVHHYYQNIYSGSHVGLFKAMGFDTFVYLFYGGPLQIKQLLWGPQFLDSLWNR